MTDWFCEGERVYLRPVQLNDVSLVVEWKKDPLIQRMALGPQVDVSPRSQREDVEGAMESDDQLYLVIVTKDGDRPIGYVRINWMDKAKRFAWLRFALGAERGKGYARDALGCLLSHLLTQGVHRVEAEAYEFNTASLKLLSSLGFEREGVKREAHFDGDSYTSVISLGLLPEDFYGRGTRGPGTAPHSVASRREGRNSGPPRDPRRREQ
jgi:ribosomal-protein-alanine N-acetyltransferase